MKIVRLDEQKEMSVYVKNRIEVEIDGKKYTLRNDNGCLQITASTTTDLHVIPSCRNEIKVNFIE